MQTSKASCHFARPGLATSVVLAAVICWPTSPGAEESKPTDRGLRDGRASSSVDPALVTSDPVVFDWSAVNWDASVANTSPAKKSLSAPNVKRNPLASSSAWNRTDKPDGSAAVTVKQSLPTNWETNVGVDFGLPPSSPTTIQPERLLTGATHDRSSGVAWTKMSVPGISLEARVDPFQEQTKLGTTLSKTVPFGGDLSLTLQNSYSLTNTATANSPASTSAPGLMAIPQTTGNTTNPSQVFSTDQIAKFNMLMTGTTLSAAAKMSSSDDKWLHSLGAEQKLFGDTSIGGSVSETVSGNPDKSFIAKFKRTW